MRFEKRLRIHLGATFIASRGSQIRPIERDDLCVVARSCLHVRPSLLVASGNSKQYASGRELAVWRISRDFSWVSQSANLILPVAFCHGHVIGDSASRESIFYHHVRHCSVTMISARRRDPSLRLRRWPSLFVYCASCEVSCASTLKSAVDLRGRNPSVADSSPLRGSKVLSPRWYPKQSCRGLPSCEKTLRPHP